MISNNDNFKYYWIRSSGLSQNETLHYTHLPCLYMVIHNFNTIYYFIMWNFCGITFIYIKDFHFCRHASDPFWTVHAVPVRIRVALHFGETVCVVEPQGVCSPRGRSHFTVFRTKWQHLCAHGINQILVQKSVWLVTPHCTTTITQKIHQNSTNPIILLYPIRVNFIQKVWWNECDWCVQSYVTQPLRTWSNSASKPTLHTMCQDESWNLDVSIVYRIKHV